MPRPRPTRRTTSPVRTSAPVAIALWTVVLVLVQASLTGLSTSSVSAVVPGALVAAAAAFSVSLQRPAAAG